MLFCTGGSAERRKPLAVAQVGKTREREEKLALEEGCPLVPAAAQQRFPDTLKTP